MATNSSTRADLHVAPQSIPHSWLAGNAGSRTAPSSASGFDGRRTSVEDGQILAIVRSSWATRCATTLAARQGIPDEWNWILFDAAQRLVASAYEPVDDDHLTALFWGFARNVAREQAKLHRRQSIAAVPLEAAEPASGDASPEQLHVLREVLRETMSGECCGSERQRTLLRILISSAGRPTAADYRAAGLEPRAATAAVHRLRLRLRRGVLKGQSLDDVLG